MSLNISKNETFFDSFSLEMNLDSINQDSLFNPTKCLVIDNCTFLTKQSILKKSSNIIDQLNKYKNEYEIFLLVNEPLIKKDVLKNHNINWDEIEIKKIDEKQKQQIINDWLKDHNITLDKSVYSQLLKCVNCDYGNIQNELTKLNLGLRQNLKSDELISLISNYNEENIFNLLEKILFKKHNEAWTIYQYLMQKQEDELMIINALSSQLYNLYYVLYMLKHNISIAKIHEVLNLPIFVINLYKSSFMNYNIDSLLKLINKFYDLEKDIKLQRVNKKIALKELILKI